MKAPTREDITELSWYGPQLRIITSQTVDTKWFNPFQESYRKLKSFPDFPRIPITPEIKDSSAELLPSLTCIMELVEVTKWFASRPRRSILTEYTWRKKNGNDS